jgi:hypothetical protein
MGTNWASGDPRGIEGAAHGELRQPKSDIWGILGVMEPIGMAVARREDGLGTQKGCDITMKNTGGEV